MGLDMYLTRKVYRRVDWERKDAVTRNDDGTFIYAGNLAATADCFDVQIAPDRVGEIIEAWGYWRKANAIHAWFVRECQEGKDECQDTYITREQLQALRDTCKKVLADQALAEELLPPQAGFFFGSTDVDDEYYMQDLKRTVTICDNALATEGGDFYYQSSW